MFAHRGSKSGNPHYEFDVSLSGCSALKDIADFNLNLYLKTPVEDNLMKK